MSKPFIVTDGYVSAIKLLASEGCFIVVYNLIFHL